MTSLSAAGDHETSRSGAPVDASAHGRGPLAAATLGAIGVVYGDIGTSPLYTVKEIFAPHTGVPLDAAHLVGAVSTIFWALMLVVTLKYVLLILRADNHGEGGGLALAALAASAMRDRPGLQRAMLLLGVVGAALFYGDSIITPAISVLGAMEGLQIMAPALAPYVEPASLVILAGLFLVQRLGTARVGRWFGPIVVLWFLVLGATGVVQIARQPAILAALNPLAAGAFLTERGPHLLFTVGAVVLAVTGAEALYADMGHFGRTPIRLAWGTLVLPCLALNYLGQGALLMAEPGAIENPFYRLFPAAWVPAALVLATLAAIIASQAVISGAYSLTRQAIQLGFLPRMTVRNTSAQAAGQIYMPAVNAVLLVGVLAAVVGFGSSSALAAAYGIAVTATMLVTTLLTYVVVGRLWRLPAWLAGGATIAFLALDGLLLAGCIVKFFDGGWFPLALAALLFLLMSTWRRGRECLVEAVRRDGVPLGEFVQSLAASGLPRAQRTAVYLAADPSTVPQALLHNLKHNQVLHEQNLVLTVRFHDAPWVPLAGRVQTQDLGHGFTQVTLNYGFMDTPDVPRALEGARVQGLQVPPFATTYFLSRATVVARPGGGALPRWREKLFEAMSRNAGGVAPFFRLPDSAVVELGTRIQV